MRWYLGYPVFAAGLAFGAHMFLPGEPSGHFPVAGPNPHASLSAAPGPTVVEAADAGLEASLPSRLSSFSPGARLLMAEAPSRSVLDYLAQALVPTAADAVAATTATVHVETASTWTSVVVPAAAPLAHPDVKPEQRAYAQRVALARDIQRELRRVGCYGGKIDGSWGSGSKRAVLMFMDRVNASLPSDAPDVFMLSLVRGQGEAVCGADCPQGQSLAANGRCLPTTLLVQADKRNGRTQVAEATASAPAAGWETIVIADRSARRLPPLEGRMGIGGPRPDDDLLPAGRLRNDGTITTGSLGEGQRTAALDAMDVAADGAGDGSSLAEFSEPEPLTSVAQPAPPSRPKATSTSRAKSASRPGWRKNYRHVQRLFEHPLGRM